MGEVFAGRYELLDPIAAGGMGTVWRVHDRQDDQIKAAKVMRQSDAASLLRFVREQSLRIDHRHIVTPSSWAGVDDRVLFTMPLVRGGSVATLLKRHGPLPPYLIGAVLDQTLEALAAVHAAGIVHRDVKPANLLLEPTGRGRPHVRLTDFGIAVAEDDSRLTHVGMVVGTPGYMSPEQKRGSDPHPSLDVYALGVVALEMLTAQRPSDDLPAPVLLPPTGDPARDAVAALIATATHPDADARPSAAQLRHHAALQRLLALTIPADAIDIFDEYADAPLTAPTPTVTAPPPPARQPTQQPATAPYAGPLPPPPAATAAAPRRTRAQTRPRPVAPTLAGPFGPYLFLIAGVVGLLLSGWLLLG